MEEQHYTDNNVEGDDQILSEAFREAIKTMELKNLDLVEYTGKTPATISNIKNGKSSPYLNDFSEILAAAEHLKPGFIQCFLQKTLEVCIERKIIKDAQTIIPSAKTIAAEIDVTDLAMLLIAFATKITQKEVETAREELQEAKKIKHQGQQNFDVDNDNDFSLIG